MSEYGQVAVLLPLNHPPSETEARDLLSIAFAAARRKANEVRGEVLGLVSAGRSQTPQGQLALRCEFAVRAPDSTWHERRTFQI